MSELGIKFDTRIMAATSRKLKASFSISAMQDISALHHSNHDEKLSQKQHEWDMEMVKHKIDVLIKGKKDDFDYNSRPVSWTYKDDMLEAMSQEITQELDKQILDELRGLHAKN